MSLKPNFIFHNEIKSFIRSGQFEINNAFDIYSLLKYKNNLYLAAPKNSNLNKLSIFLIKEKKFIKILSLQHTKAISGCKYFCNVRNKKEYLISTTFDINEKDELTIWVILSEKNYNNLFKLLINRKSNSRSFFSLLFNEKTFLIYNSSENVSSILSIENKKVIKNIGSENCILEYINWYNKRDNQKYIIQCNEENIIIFNPFLDKIEFKEIKIDEVKGSNYSACIIYNKNNTDILCISNENGNIIIYDLLKGKIDYIIKIKDTKLRHICEYNNQYIIVVSETGFFLIIDLNDKKIISKIASEKLKDITTVKIIRHNLYGEYLLFSGFCEPLLIWKNLSNI